MRHRLISQISGTPSMVCAFAHTLRGQRNESLSSVPRGRVGRADRRRLGIRTHDPGRLMMGHEKRRRAIIAS
jgi:hypothetical protein